MPNFVESITEKDVKEMLENNGLFVDELRKPDSCSTFVAKFNIYDDNIEEAKTKALRMIEILKDNNCIIDPIANRAHLKSHPKQGYWELDAFLYAPVVLIDEELINDIKSTGWTIDEVLESDRMKGEYTIRRKYTSDNAGEYAIAITGWIAYGLRSKGYIVKILEIDMSDDKNNWNMKNIDVTFALYR